MVATRITWQPASELWRLLAIGAALLALTVIGPAVHARLGDIAFVSLAVTQGLLVAYATWRAGYYPERSALWLILGVALALRLALLFTTPHLSTDIYRYVWDGRMQAAGINPYRYLPAAPELAPLRDAAIYPLINRKDYAPTIYPPTAQMLFFITAWLSDSLVAMKLAMIASEAVTVAVVLDMLRRLGRPAARVLAYAWHPLAVWEIAGSGHIDAVMVAGTMLGLWVALVLRRPLLAAGILAAATLVKPFAALALPAAWRPWDWRAPAVAVAVAALLYVPYLSVGAGVLGFMPAYLGEENIASAEAFWLVGAITWLTGPLAWVKPLYMALAAALLGVLALAVPFGRDDRPEDAMLARLTRVFWLVLAFVMVLSPNYPWYYLMLVPFVAVLGPLPGWAASILCFLLYDVIWGDFTFRTPAFDNALFETLFNLTVLSAVLLALRQGRTAANPRETTP